jgi:hypothetical protein
MTRFLAGSGAALSLLAAGCCCRGSVEDRVAAAQRENARLKFEVDATEKANSGMRDYTKELESGSGPAYALYFTDNDLQAFARKAMPYRIPASSFNKQLQGTIVVDRLYDFAFHAGNRMTAKMDMRGQNIRFTGDVPDFAKGQVKDFIEGVEAGVIADLDITLTISGQRLKALAQCTNTKLKKNSSSSNEGRLKDEMNKRALKDPLDFDLRISGYTARLDRVIVTANHLVVGYKP